MAGDGRPASRGAWFGGRRVVGLIVGFEAVVYAVAFLLLALSAVLVVVGSAGAVFASLRQGDSALDGGILVLDRVLLVLIIAEIAYTLRTVLQGDDILVAEPFLVISLIAVVRRILIVTAEFERSPSDDELTRLLIELGALGVLVLAITTAIFMLRYSRRKPVADDRAEAASGTG